MIPVPTVPTVPTPARPIALAAMIAQLMPEEDRFDESALVSGSAPSPSRRSRRSWRDWPARAFRYDLLWGHYDGNPYRRIHRYAERLKEEYGLYEFIRPMRTAATSPRPQTLFLGSDTT